MSSDLQRALRRLTGRVKGLRYAVRFDNFRLGNSFGLAAYLNNLEGLLREEVAPAIEIHGAQVAQRRRSSRAQAPSPTANPAHSPRTERSRPFEVGAFFTGDKAHAIT
jgi:hypothetical protein